MRPDLNKLLCERERTHSGMRYREVRRAKIPRADEDGDNRPTREGMKRRYGYESKEFNENLSPLKGQIRKAVGRPWDKFYGELCAVFDQRSVINQHILQHLKDFIEQDVLFKNGEPYVRSRYAGPDMPLGWSRAEFFVDPRTRIIRVNKYRERHLAMQRLGSKLAQTAQAAWTRRLDDTTVLHKIDGTWFVFEARPIPQDTEVFDVLLKQLVKRNPYHKENLYYVNKRTASRKLLRSIGL